MSATIGANATVAAVPHDGAYLLIVEPNSSRRIDLPGTGTLYIGRDVTAEVRLEHKSVSRRHARLWVDASGIHIADDGSHNGTRVNGDALSTARTLCSGDCVSVGDVVLVLHVERARPETRARLTEAAFRVRLAEEVERTLVYRRSIALLAVCGLPSTEAVSARLQGVLRLMDLAGSCDDGTLFLFLPELSADAAMQAAGRVHAALAGLAPESKVGIAMCPLDACNVDDLLVAARAAARAASAGHTATGAATATRLDLDGRGVLLAAPAMLRQFELIRRLAVAELPVLITGETGVGKENAAYAVHFYSPRRDKPFLPVNCAAIPETLVESTLFGHEKGAFSGAMAAKTGLLESAAGGTIFLDEIGELPAAVQAKLLRALESGRVTRVGDTRERHVDVRVVAASNRDLEQEVRDGRFRADLYFRLGAKVLLPPLRARRCEIPLLAREFVELACKRLGRTVMDIAPAAMQLLITYHWPGNVRDLRMVMDVLAATVEDDRIEPADLPPQLGGSTDASTDAQTAPAVLTEVPGAPPAGEPRPRDTRPLAEELDDLVRARMLDALAASGGVRTRAAQMLGMPIRTFTYKLKQFGLKG